MNDDDPIDLERERRVRRKIRGLGKAIKDGGERDEFEEDPIRYLESKAEMNPDQQTFTVSEIAELLDVTNHTVRRWCRNGELEAAKLGSAGYRVSRESLASFWREKSGGGELFPREQNGDYRIESQQGYKMGVYAGETPAEALANMHREHGYNVDYDDDSDAVEFPDDETRQRCGGVDQWEIVEVES